ncbi:uncharacterized protein LOC124912460 [Impatiens glandulifera]|uniref:uncharacterized protein LOC124912460 n=1 Tax=Impatiens glandulifera TaxID=253017 RepID=UPI001FB14F51|nr:uncharacterized protein LOC124912460 [Impatiens glandulifera]XP_047309043.1 uncharacterized protein LOC124912460 [Impatiens glandulifera]
METGDVRKRLKLTVQDENTEEVVAGDKAVVVVEEEEEESEVTTMASEQMENDISNILEKINQFTQMVSELLESGKSFFKELSNEFEERVILVHKEQIDKWQEDIKELRMLDASNEDTNAVLYNAQNLFQNVQNETI